MGTVSNYHFSEGLDTLTIMIKQQPHAYTVIYRHRAFCCYHPIVIEIVQISEKDNILKRLSNIISKSFQSAISLARHWNWCKYSQKA